MQHLFKRGEVVRLSQGVTARPPSRTEYKVTQQLPERGGELQYRIKTEREAFERVVWQSALEKV